MLSAAQEAHLTTHLARDKITKAYTFRATYDGTLGEPALTFRNSITVWVDTLKLRLGNRYDEERVMPLLIEALIDGAEEHLGDIELLRATTVAQYLKWFDETFNLRNLRLQLYNTLKDSYKN